MHHEKSGNPGVFLEVGFSYIIFLVHHAAPNLSNKFKRRTATRLGEFSAILANFPPYWTVYKKLHTEKGQIFVLPLFHGKSYALPILTEMNCATFWPFWEAELKMIIFVT
jgi:hypothetical protein